MCHLRIPVSFYFTYIFYNIFKNMLVLIVFLATSPQLFFPCNYSTLCLCFSSINLFHLKGRVSEVQNNLITKQLKILWSCKINLPTILLWSTSLFFSETTKRPMQRPFNFIPRRKLKEPSFSLVAL